MTEPNISATPFKLISVTHGAVNLGNIKRIRVTEAFETTPIVGGAASGPSARPVSTRDLIAEITSTEFLATASDVSAGTKDTLTISFTKSDFTATGTPTGGALTLSHMIRTGQEYDHEHNTPGEHVTSFAVEDDMTSSPLAVT